MNAKTYKFENKCPNCSRGRKRNSWGILLRAHVLEIKERVARTRLQVGRSMYVRNPAGRALSTNGSHKQCVLNFYYYWFCSWSIRTRPWAASKTSTNSTHHDCGCLRFFCSDLAGWHTFGESGPKRSPFIRQTTKSGNLEQSTVSNKPSHNLKFWSG